jgi:hypothetical protein
MRPDERDAGMADAEGAAPSTGHELTSSTAHWSSAMQGEFVELQGPPPDACQHLVGRRQRAQIIVGPVSGERVVAHCRKWGKDLDLHAMDLGVKVSELTEECLKGEGHCPIARRGAAGSDNTPASN